MFWTWKRRGIVTGKFQTRKTAVKSDSKMTKERSDQYISKNNGWVMMGTGKKGKWWDFSQEAEAAVV